jgi:hypothetical protein
MCGTLSKFVHGKCRCGECKAAWAKYKGDWRRAKANRLAAAAKAKADGERYWQEMYERLSRKP